MTSGADALRIDQGAVRGSVSGGAVAYLGIPYAAAPVEGLRLAAPATAPSWSGVRSADRFGPAAPQSALVQGFGLPPERTSADGGWLTVNVWRPQGDASGLPVLVFVYGGAFLSGAASNPTYDGARLAAEQGLVVVTFDYRLGPEGFAALEGYPLNRALRDQIAALQWVQRTIGAFGGDAERVTLVGQSAGACCVAALLAAPAARGLFSRAVLHSVPRSVVTLGLARRVAAELAIPGGAPPDPAELAAIGDRLVRAAPAHSDRWGVLAALPSPWGPVVDGDLLPTDPWRALTAGAARDVPVIVGHTRDEFRLFRALAGRLETPDDAADEASLARFGPPGAAEEALTGQALAVAAEVAQSDWLFRMPSFALARAAAAGGGSVHLFEVTQPVTRPGLGAPHSSDVPLLFGNLTGGSARFLYEDAPSAASRSVGEAMRRSWSRFAHDGDPGWTPFTEQGLATRVFGPGAEVVQYPERESAAQYAGGPVTALDVPTGSDA